MDKKRKPLHFVNAEMMADYLDEHNGELPHDRDKREYGVINYGCADIDDFDKLIKRMYGKL